MLDGYEDFIAKVDHELDLLGISKDDVAMVDHLCYRTETMDQYETVKAEFSKISRSIAEVMVQGRPIATFEFSPTLKASGWSVAYVEVPAPKQGNAYKQGIEHAEFVIIGEMDTFRDKYNHIAFNDSTWNDAINPELVVTLTDGTGVIKFHHQSVGAALRIGKSLNLLVNP